MTGEWQEIWEGRGGGERESGERVRKRERRGRGEKDLHKLVP